MCRQCWILPNIAGLGTSYLSGACPGQHRLPAPGMALVTGMRAMQCAPAPAACLLALAGMRSDPTQPDLKCYGQPLPGDRLTACRVDHISQRPDLALRVQDVKGGVLPAVPALQFSVTGTLAVEPAMYSVYGPAAQSMHSL